MEYSIIPLVHLSLELQPLLQLASSDVNLTCGVIKGAGGGVPWVQFMENEFECLVVRRGDGGHFAEKFVKKYCS